MPAAETPVAPAEAAALFADLSEVPVLVLAVSGGPDSTALMWLAARWRAARKRGPKLVAVTVDHGLRAQSAAEARTVKRLAARLGLAHRTVRWRGEKPATGIAAAARHARYRLLAAAARRAGAHHVVTAHTRDDQAETVLFRLARGSGLAGLGAMARIAPLPVAGWESDTNAAGRNAELLLVRPFLAISKARLVATLRAAKIPFLHDPSNVDPRFTRARMRKVMPLLATEGLDAERLVLLARRAARAEAALAAAVAAARSRVSPTEWSNSGPILLDRRTFKQLPAEVALRILGQAVTAVGAEGPVELGKLEALFDAVADRGGGQTRDKRLRRTLAGALVTVSADRIAVERAPARRGNRPQRPPR